MDPSLFSSPILFMIQNDKRHVTEYGINYRPEFDLLLALVKIQHNILPLYNTLGTSTAENHLNPRKVSTLGSKEDFSSISGTPNQSTQSPKKPTHNCHNLEQTTAFKQIKALRAQKKSTTQQPKQRHQE